MEKLHNASGSLGAGQAFALAAQPKPPKGKAKANPPFSLRLTAEERFRLQEDAGSVPLGAYIRSRLFDEAVARPRQGPNRHPIKDHQALAKVLGELGQARIANNLNQLAKAANCGVLDLTPEKEARLLAACEDIRAMRHALMTALGMDGGKRP